MKKPVIVALVMLAAWVYLKRRNAQTMSQQQRMLSDQEAVFAPSDFSNLFGAFRP